MSSEEEKWEEFYGLYRSYEEAPPELIELAAEVQRITPPEQVDTSDHAVIVMDADQLQDIMDFLNAINAPVPLYVMMSPLHADPKEMSNMLNNP